MQGIAAAATGLLVVASFAVGVRLLLLHRRTGAAPELLLGAMLLLTVGVGYPLMMAGTLAGGAWAGTLQVAASAFIAVGFSLLFAFTCRVFRPEAGWARALAALGALALAARVVHLGIQVKSQGALDFPSVPLRDVLFQTGPVTAAYVWTAWESLRYRAMMRRRERLGLADAAVSDRFLLWGVMALVAVVGVTISTVAAALHVDMMRTPSLLLLSSATGMAQVVLLVLTFLPPRAYLRWVRSRTAAPAA